MPRLFREPPYHPLMSHQMPCEVWMPGCDITLRFYPASVELFCQPSQEMLTLLFDHSCRFLTHTLSLDLRKKSIMVEGTTPSSFQRLEWRMQNGQLMLHSHKGEVQGTWRGTPFSIRKGEPLILMTCHSKEAGKGPALVLHSPTNGDWNRLHTKQRWLTLVEQLYELNAFPHEIESHSFLGDELSFALPCTPMEAKLQELLMNGFQGILVPRVGEKNTERWGRVYWPYMSVMSNLISLASLLRSLFICEEKGSITLLPKCLPSMLSGQLINETIFNEKVKVSFDWRRREIRRVLLTPVEDVVCRLHIPRCASCRLRRINHREVSSLSLEKEHDFKKGQSYLLDNFIS